MNSHGGRIGLVTSLTVMTLLGATACGGSDDSTTESKQTPGATGVTYQPSGKGCDNVDTTAMDAVLGASQIRDEGLISSTVGSQVNCAKSYDKFTVTVRTQSVKGADGKIIYDGFRGVQEKSGVELTEVPGVGTAAFTYVDEITGPQLEAWDGNMYLSISVNELDEGGDVDGAAKALPAVATATFAKIRG
ncbi:hypothetical protein [Actinoplanes sp. NPDC051494]|uniref:hypothetical protein n=1 Tax=Actinoplanes sp. NPDC051494 TaxID=3363907 RepID=UPI0037885D06